MVRLREIPRTATFAWSPGTALPLIATGTRAGAVDADFSNDTQLELWDLDLGNIEQGVELQPTASISTDSRFHDIAWGRINDDYPRGVIAGALENGSLDLWNAEKLLQGASNAFMSRTSKHSGAIKTLQFNPFRPELLATAGAKGELFISDLNNVANPFRLGSTAARADDFECLDWNKKVAHIIVTGSSGGFVTVWDVKAKKESLTLNNLGRKAVSAVAWDPEKPTKLITAIPNDTDPLILVWDLRNTNAPERTLRSHEQGVLSVSWCPQDSDLLLSCGKDNRTICWNTQSGQPYGEFPVVTNWTFQTRWNPHNPSLLATASFDGKIAVQTIQNTGPETGPIAGGQNQAVDGEDFFNKAQTQPQGATFSLPKPPKWLERPCGASFGFGGKVVRFSLVEPEATSMRKSRIHISHFEVDPEVGAATQSFEKALSEGDLENICKTNIEEATTDEDKADWKVIRTLISNNPRKELIDYLGFSTKNDEAADGLAKLGLGDESAEHSIEARSSGTATTKGNRLSAFFDNSADGDSFLSDIAATKGAKTNNPFQIYTGQESESDRRITRALMLGQFEKALEVCLQEDRLSDAFMIAICGGQTCIEKAQKAYFTKKIQGPNYLRLLASVVEKNLWDVVYNADLASWKEVMATLCTFADANEFPDLCEALGDRLEEQTKEEGEGSELRKDASFCYLAGSKLEKVVTLWIEELQEHESSGTQESNSDSTFSVHVRSLQKFIEKVTIFREVTHFQDNDRQKASGWKLAPLYDQYTEYAEVVAAHGQLNVAEKYLSLLPAEYPAAELAKSRVRQAAGRETSRVPTKQPTNSIGPGLRAQTASGGSLAQQPPMMPSATPAASAFVPAYPAQPSNPYAPQSAGLYASAGYSQVQQSRQASGMVPPPSSSFGASQSNSSLGPPPRAYNASPSIPAPSKATNMTNWNDTPDSFFKPPTSRRGTPGMTASTINSPFPNHTNLSSPPTPGPPYGMPQRSTPPLPPPPKGSAPPPRLSSPLSGGLSQPYQHPERPSSSAANPYAPQQLMPHPIGGNQQPTIPRGSSPYNAPPPGAPPSNRYAPVPALQSNAPSRDEGASMLPPPTSGQRQGPPPTNPYAPQQNQGNQQHNTPNPYGSGPPFQQQASQNPPPGPPQGLPQGSRPGTAQSQRGQAATPASKYPAGDRSHIPPNAQPIFEILNGDMQRVKSRAPASFKPQVTDTEKRLNILFDHLNNEDLLKPDTVDNMSELAHALQARNYEQAQAIHVDILTNKTDECGNWMVGVKRLIGMSRATP
ncbi:MAG: protein transport protein S31 [Pleopsidium flavum]|nr:MAG: protein transport protein S31 [Pleopsidium flavum]